uniref:POU domain protein n=1 Tax=Malurus cyaneus samueli TaxID=2593467 RepID=A0A8C5U7U6_9PASS
LLPIILPHPPFPLTSLGCRLLYHASSNLFALPPDPVLPYTLILLPASRPSPQLCPLSLYPQALPLNSTAPQPHSSAPFPSHFALICPLALCSPRTPTLFCVSSALEAFAERFKQRRIKLGVTQADVGSALANLKIPGVGSLSQSTICRFESLTLSHNNMIALKPILQAWLEEAEGAQREKMNKPELFNGGEKKRKRTSIAAPEKRSLEAYFAVQPRPSSEKIAAIAEKLDLKKNVVRFGFAQTDRQTKRMKFRTTRAQVPLSAEMHQEADAKPAKLWQVCQ